MSLIDKIRRARQVAVEAGGKPFTIRRPTDEEAIAISRDNASLLDVVKRFTVGWGLQEVDLVPGGSPVAVPFDADLFGEWVADQPEVWEPLGNAIMDAYKAHADKRDTAAKN
jgi:hypothetical protein